MGTELSEPAGGDRDWAPVDELSEDLVAAGATAALHGLLDSPGKPPGENDPLPPLWHWLAFLPRVPQRQLGPDGHPIRGTFLPPISLPRRMFVGGEVSFALDAPRIGARLARKGRVITVEEKVGGSGQLTFVTVGYRITPITGTDCDPVAAAEIGTVETQHLVYRPAAARSATGLGRPLPKPVHDRLVDSAWSMGFDLSIDSTILFRFSALTYNAHRIHYDRQWATEVEGYPGLVVQGPLQAIALAEVCRRNLPEASLEHFAFRCLKPVFDGGMLHLRGRINKATVHLAAFDPHGGLTMSATAQLRTGRSAATRLQ